MEQPLDPQGIPREDKEEALDALSDMVKLSEHGQRIGEQVDRNFSKLARSLAINLVSAQYTRLRVDPAQVLFDGMMGILATAIFRGKIVVVEGKGAEKKGGENAGSG